MTADPKLLQRNINSTGSVHLQKFPHKQPNYKIIIHLSKTANKINGYNEKYLQK